MRLPILLGLLLAAGPAFAATTAHQKASPRHILQKRRQARRRGLVPARQRRLLRRRGLDGNTLGSAGAPGSSAGQAPQGFRPPAVSYDAPTHGTKSEDPGSGRWQPGFGSISGDHMQPLNGAGLGAPAPAQSQAPAGSAGGNAITPNN